MSNTSVSLRRKISNAGDLQSVIRMMKALAARFELGWPIHKAAGRFFADGFRQSSCKM